MTPEPGTWAFARACRDLASDLSALRPGPSGQIVAPLHRHQHDLLVGMLTREANRIEDGKMDLFDRTTGEA